ncbi:uncharacterized protein LOC119657418 isoform X2 [Hermetia illucens]|uniref:uncharacterized protein LOC119657418 isoform X2 n=1 Tax=Hermetia illucens TaxID=343691 RepID=UPI0018CC686B|nr:uncharacterized protein LOC119657418 isoform X2 [Hermetia illucens]
MASSDIVRPGLWAFRRQLPEIKVRLRSRVPHLNYIEVRRLNLPFYEALTRELYEEGFNVTAEYLSRLFKMEAELVENESSLRLFHRKDFLLAIAEAGKNAEAVARFNEDKSLAFQMLLEMIQLVERQGRRFWWLTGQLYKIVFNIMVKCGVTNNEVECRARYYYARFLDEKMYQYNQAIEEYRIAKLQTEELDWVTDEVSYHLLFREICRGYVSAILHKAHHIKIFDLKEANLLMSHALPMMYQYSDKEEICQQLINWSDILVDLNHLNKAIKVLTNALKYSFSCQSSELRCLILLKQGLTLQKLKNTEKCIEKLSRSLEIADGDEYQELRALARMHLGFILSKETQEMAKGVGLLSESIRIFQKLGNMQNLRKAEYYLAVSKANQIFDDVCTTIRGAFTNDVCQKPFLSKWKAWFFRKNVSWVAKSGAEEIKDKAIILNEKYYTDGFLEAAFNNPDTGRRPNGFSPNQIL